MSIEYRPAVPVTIVTGKHRARVISSAPNVAALLQSQGVHLGKYDSVTPALTESVPTGGTVRIDHFLTWHRIEHRIIAMPTIKRVDVSLKPGAAKVANKGQPGMFDVLVSFTQNTTTIVERKAHPCILRKGREFMRKPLRTRESTTSTHR